MRTWYSAFLAATLCALPALASPKVGEAAPAFELVDADGKARKLAEFAGKTVVLEWTNAGCPFVKKHYGSGNMQALQKQAQGEGVVWLTINSSATGKQGHTDGAGAKKLLAEQGAAPAAYLLDPEGRVGRLYGAKVTPHMYVIDGKGTLVYMGAIDDNPSANPADAKTAKNYVTQALKELAAGKAISEPTTRAYGCGVKYAG